MQGSASRLSAVQGSASKGRDRQWLRAQIRCAGQWEREEGKAVLLGAGQWERGEGEGTKGVHLCGGVRKREGQWSAFRLSAVQGSGSKGRDRQWLWAQIRCAGQWEREEGKAVLLGAGQWERGEGEGTKGVHLCGGVRKREGQWSAFRLSAV